MVSTILGGLKKWWCRVHRSCTELQQILQNSNVLVWTALEQMSNSTVTFPTKWRANGQTRLGLSTNQDWRNYPLSAPPNTTTTPLSFHIFGRFDWTSLKKVMVRACFFKKNDPPRAWPFGWLKAPCFSPTVFDAGRLAFHHHAASAGRSGRTPSGETTEDGSKVRAFGEIVVFSCWVFWKYRWKKYGKSI